MAKIWRKFDANWGHRAVYYSDWPPEATAADKYMTMDDGPNRQLFANYEGWWHPYSDWEHITAIKAWPNPFAEPKPTFNHGEAQVSFTKAIAARDEWVKAHYARWLIAELSIKALLHEIYTELEQR